MSGGPKKWYFFTNNGQKFMIGVCFAISLLFFIVGDRSTGIIFLFGAGLWLFAWFTTR